jgi:hypothetical protein
MRRWGEAPGDQFKQPLSLMVLRRWLWFTVGSLNPYGVVVKIGATSADACGRRVSIARLFFTVAAAICIPQVLITSTRTQHQLLNTKRPMMLTVTHPQGKLIPCRWWQPRMHRWSTVWKSPCHLKSIERASKT